MPNTSCMPNVGIGFFPPITTTSKATTVDANLPKGDGVGVSNMAGRFTIVNDATQDKTKIMGISNDSNPIMHSVDVN